jgi:hypothetical protein
MDLKDHEKVYNNHIKDLIKVRLCVGYPRCKQTGYYAHVRTSAAQKSKEPSAGESSRLPPQGSGYSASLNKVLTLKFVSRRLHITQYSKG